MKLFHPVYHFNRNIKEYSPLLFTFWIKNIQTTQFDQRSTPTRLFCVIHVFIIEFHKLYDLLFYGTLIDINY